METELTATNQSITELKELEVQNQTRQEQILALEKQKTRLPPQLQSVLDKANEEGVDVEYMKEVFHEALEEFAAHLPKNPRTREHFERPTITPDQVPGLTPCAFSKYLVESAEYNSLCRAARDFFLYQELIKYQKQSSNSTDASIKSRQSQLDFEFSATKKHISTKLPVEDAKRHTITGKLATLGNQIKLLETDLSNTEANSKLDEEIQTLQTKRTRYETRIEAVETELQTIRTRILAFVEIEKLEL